MDRIDRLIGEWLEAGYFPGCVLEVRKEGETAVSRAYGSFSGPGAAGPAGAEAELSEPARSSRREPSDPAAQSREPVQPSPEPAQPMTARTMFDAASLTKVTVTLPAVLLLAQEGRLALTDAVRKHIPEFRHPGVTIRDCLTHASGLPAAVPGFRERYATRDIWQEMLALDLAYATGTKVLYSDIGMVLLGEIVARLSGERLDRFAQRRIFEPLGMRDSCFTPPADRLHRIAPTEWDGTRWLTGLVHDETAFRLGGVAGNAGLFTTAGDLSRYASLWLYPERHGMLDRQWIEACFEKPIQDRGLGWQLWLGQADPPACGGKWPIGSFGHTGFTGTSLWIDPVRKLSVVWMTNAVHYGRDNPVRQLRPALHEAAVQTAFSDI